MSSWWYAWIPPASSFSPPSAAYHGCPKWPEIFETGSKQENKGGALRRSLPTVQACKLFLASAVDVMQAGRCVGAAAAVVHQYNAGEQCIGLRSVMLQN